MSVSKYVKIMNHSEPIVFDKLPLVYLIPQIKSSNPYTLLTNWVNQINGTTNVVIFINISSNEKAHRRIYWVRGLKRPHPESDLDIEGFWPKRDRLNDKTSKKLDKVQFWKNPNRAIYYSYQFILLQHLPEFFRYSFPEAKSSYERNDPEIQQKTSLDELVTSPIDNSLAENDEWCLKSNFVQHDKFSNIFYVVPDGVSSSMPNTRLRPIILDGSNIAMAHGMHRAFSPEGIIICLNYFLQKGHTVKVFLPQSRKRNFNFPVLSEMEAQNIFIFTPSRIVGGKCVTCYDDRYMIQYAAVTGGIVVSNDFFRDLYDENEEWRDTLKTKILPFTWVSTTCLMFPTDPLGRNGPTFERFLKFS